MSPDCKDCSAPKTVPADHWSFRPLVPVDPEDVPQSTLEARTCKTTGGMECSGRHPSLVDDRYEVAGRIPRIPTKICLHVSKTYCTMLICSLVLDSPSISLF